MCSDRKFQRKILIVDDDDLILRSTENCLNMGGILNTITLSDSRKVKDIVEQEDVAIVLLDLFMPHVGGEEVLSFLTENFPHILVIIVTGFNDVDRAVNCIRGGAFDYLVKPVEGNRMITSLTRAMDFIYLRDENQRFRESLNNDSLDNPHFFEHIITNDPKLFRLFKYMEAIALNNHSVMITGETGVGKELFARALHMASGRSGEFVAVNIGGLDDTLFSDTLFGHLKGAYTGAQRDRKGLIEEAKDGTLFLDEIGDLSLTSQVKLLRLLQEGVYYPLGSDRPKKSSARVVVATHCDLKALQKKDGFRRDLFYRLNSHHIHIPPLKDRLVDLPLLVDYFFECASKELGKKTPSYPKELLILLSNYSFPGNIRELESFIFDAVSGHRGKVLSLDSFRAKLDFQGDHMELVGSSRKRVNFKEKEGSPSTFEVELDYFPTIKQMNALHIEKALNRTSGNQSIAAKLLGVSRQGLNRKIRENKP